MKVTERRTAVDFAVCMRELVDLHYPKAELIRVVLDNLSTHSVGAFYQAFPAEEARRLLRRIEFHYVPKHASWLNMVEIEIGVLAGQCLDRRIESCPPPSPKSPPGRNSATPPAPASTGAHNRKGPTQNRASLSKAHKSKAASKSQNLCAEILAPKASKTPRPSVVATPRPERISAEFHIETRKRDHGRRGE